MSKKQLQIKNSKVKKNLRWHILRLLRLNSRTRQELLDKLSDMYLGYEAVMGIIQRHIQTEVDWSEIERLDVIGIDEISLKKELPKEEYKELKGAMWILRRHIEELTGEDLEVLKW
jgi:hypothetical protein